MARVWKTLIVCVLVVANERVRSGATSIPPSHLPLSSNPRCSKDAFCYDGFILTEWKDRHQCGTRFLYWNESTDGTTLFAHVGEHKISRTALVRMSPNGNIFASVFTINTKTGSLGIDDQGCLIHESQNGTQSSTTFLISKVWCEAHQLIGTHDIKKQHELTRKQDKRCTMVMCAVRRRNNGTKQAFLVAHPSQSGIRSFQISDPNVCQDLVKFRAAINGEWILTRNIRKLRELILDDKRKHFEHYQFEFPYPKKHQAWL